MVSRRTGVTLVELVIGLLLLSLFFYGAFQGVTFFTRPIARGDPALDLAQEMCVGTESIERELRESRRIIFPKAGGPEARTLVYRDFDGRIMAFCHDPVKGELSLAQLYPAPPAPGTPRRLSKMLDRVYFTVSLEGLTTWGLFSGETGVFGSSRRQNR